jgi:prevent-host-death family protein
METIGAAKFKEQCLSLLDNLPDEGLVITKHGKPVAMVVPYSRKSALLIGRLRDKMAVRGDIISSGVRWNADAES